MAIQDVVSTSFAAPQNRKPEILSPEQERHFSAKLLTELPMSRKESARSDISMQDGTESAQSEFSFFVDSPAQEMPSWQPVQPEYNNANALVPCPEGNWNPHFESEYNDRVVDYHHFQSVDQTSSRRAATKESTGMLKEWLRKNSKNPYPSKNEKIMLAIVTKMSLTQVSTWFANARRRLKKENKMTWIPKNRSNDVMNSSSRKRLSEESPNKDAKDLNSTTCEESIQMGAELNYRNGFSCSIPASENRLNYYPLPDVSSSFGKVGHPSPVSQPYPDHGPHTAFKALDPHYCVSNRDHLSPQAAHSKGVHGDGYEPNFYPPLSSDCHRFNGYRNEDNAFPSFSHAQGLTTGQENGDFMNVGQYGDGGKQQGQFLHQCTHNYQQNNHYYQYAPEMTYHNYQTPPVSQCDGFGSSQWSGEGNPVSSHGTVPSTGLETGPNSDYVSPPATDYQQTGLNQHHLETSSQNCSDWKSCWENAQINASQSTVSNYNEFKTSQTKPATFNQASTGIEQDYCDQTSDISLNNPTTTTNKYLDNWKLLDGWR